MASAGRILIMPKGEYNAETEYEMLDMVHYNGTSWLAKQTAKGIEPSDANSEYWQNVFAMSPTDYLRVTGGTVTGDVNIEKPIPQFRLRASETRATTIHKNATEEIDHGTAIIDRSDDVRTLLIIQNGILTLQKQINGTVVGEKVIAEISG